MGLKMMVAMMAIALDLIFWEIHLKMSPCLRRRQITDPENSSKTKS